MWRGFRNGLTNTNKQKLLDLKVTSLWAVLISSTMDLFSLPWNFVKLLPKFCKIPSLVFFTSHLTLLFLVRRKAWFEAVLLLVSRRHFLLTTPSNSFTVHLHKVQLCLQCKISSERLLWLMSNHTVLRWALCKINFRAQEF